MKINKLMAQKSLQLSKTDLGHPARAYVLYFVSVRAARMCEYTTYGALVSHRVLVNATARPCKADFVTRPTGHPPPDPRPRGRSESRTHKPAGRRKSR